MNEDVVFATNSLFNSGPWIIETYGKTFVELNKRHPEIEVPSKETIEGFQGPSVYENVAPILKAPALIEEAQTLYRSFHDTEEGLKAIAPYPGIREMLVALKDQGKKLYIVTEKAASAAQSQVDFNGFSDLFEAVAGTSAKGKSETLGQLIGTLETNHALNPENTIYVLGRKRATETASKMGYNVIGTTWTGTTAEEYFDAGAANVVSKPSEAANLKALFSEIPGAKSKNANPKHQKG